MTAVAKVNFHPNVFANARDVSDKRSGWTDPSASVCDKCVACGFGLCLGGSGKIGIGLNELVSLATPRLHFRQLAADVNDVHHRGEHYYDRSRSNDRVAVFVNSRDRPLDWLIEKFINVFVN